MPYNKYIPLSTSIVTYNTEPVVLEGALASIANNMVTTKTYVIDNSPSDNLASTAKKYSASYIHTNSNVGFGRGHNMALRLIGYNSKYHLILNPDVSFDAHVLNELYEFLEINPEIGWVMPNILYPDGTRQNLCKRLPSPWDLIRRRFLINYKKAYFSKGQDRFECSDLDLTKPRSIPYLSGCFAFVRTHLIQEVGGFDERFFLYLEDTDLVRRIGELSHTVYYPYANVYHVHGRGSYRNLKMLHHHLLSAIQYFSKWGWFIDRKRWQVNRSSVFEKRYITTLNNLNDLVIT